MDPVFLTIGSLEIRWYSVLILVAVFICYGFIKREAKLFKFNQDKIFNMMFWALLLGIIGARLYYVVFNYQELYVSDPKSILYIWEGGLAIHGGIFMGLIAVASYCKIQNWRLAKITDIIVVPLLLAQAIGRWGNFFNQEAYGAATTVETLRKVFVPEFVINGVTINGVVYTPTFWFESILCLVAFIILLFVRRAKTIKVGTLTAIYLIFYGSLRFVIEMSRLDALMIGPIKIAQVVSVIMVVFGIGMLMLISRKGKFDDLYNPMEIG